jgi:hypothetical protein
LQAGPQLSLAVSSLRRWIRLETRCVPFANAPPLVKLAPFQDLNNLIDWFKQAEANRRTATTALAVERYRLQHGRWPDSLEALVSAQLLRQVPLDPYDGKPLRYRPSADGVWSILLAQMGRGTAPPCTAHLRARISHIGVPTVECRSAPSKMKPPRRPWRTTVPKQPDGQARTFRKAWPAVFLIPPANSSEITR